MTARPAISHLISLQDWSDKEVDALIDLSLALKRGEKVASLAGQCVGLLFFRGSLRTRASFEAAAKQLGGNTINLTASSDFWELETQEGSLMDGRGPEPVT